jgi:uncharacterized membrane protein
MTQKEKPSKDILEKWHKDPSNWICGIFYYNIEDKRIFPPKRMAWAGWTINFANPRSILFLVVIILFLAFVVSTVPDKL